jgi:hypothetical protein
MSNHQSGGLPQISLKLDPDLRDALARAAQAQRRTVSNMARVLLERALEQQGAGAHENGHARPQPERAA